MAFLFAVLLIYFNSFFANPLLANVPYITMVIELSGINMAATTGDKAPCTAKLKPTKL